MAQVNRELAINVQNACLREFRVKLLKNSGSVRWWTNPSSKPNTLLHENEHPVKVFWVARELPARA